MPVTRKIRKLVEDWKDEANYTKRKGEQFNRAMNSFMIINNELAEECKKEGIDINELKLIEL